LHGVGRLVVPRAETVEACGDERLGVCVGQFVARDLLADEAVVRFVRVEGGDDVVA
jgi:hypothetical protein